MISKCLSDVYQTNNEDDHLANNFNNKHKHFQKHIRSMFVSKVVWQKQLCGDAKYTEFS